MRGSAALRTGVTPGGALAGPWVRNPLWTAARAVPSLDLCFADTKSLVCATTGQNLVSHTRASSGTFVGSDGVLQNAVTNLCLQSQAISLTAPWASQSTAPTITANAFAAPDGTTTATKVTFAAADSRVIQATISLTSGTIYTFSVYARPVTPGTLNTIRLAVFDTVQQNGPDIALIAGWQRISYTFTASSTTASGTVQFRNATNIAANDVYLWGAQLEQASAVGEYVPTTSTINSAPRFDHAIKSSTTNLLLRSEEFDNASWTTDSVQILVSPNAIISPTGTSTADKIIANTTNGFHALRQFSSVTNGLSYTQSIYAKAGEYSVLQLITSTGFDGSGLFYRNFILSNGSLGNGTLPAAITPVGNGWYRISVTATATSTNAVGRFNMNVLNADTASPNPAYTGDGTSGLFLWGAQLEQSATAGPYVPTTTAAATSFGTESLGLLVEEARTNSVTNNTMVGAVAGTPGTNPTGWLYATASSNGLTLSIVGTGVENGINYIDYRFNGTTIASPSPCAIGLVNATAATGQTWTASIYWKLVGGTTTGVTNWQIGIIENTAGGAFVTGAFYNQTTPTSAALITQRPAATRTLSGGATVGLLSYPLSFAVAGNTAIDCTLRIGLPQLEQGAFATSVIPTVGAGVITPGYIAPAVTRAADVAQIAGSNFGTTRTNLLVRSEEFSDAIWGPVSGTVTANAETSPAGTLTADKLIAANGGPAGQLFQSVTIASGATVTGSVYAKAGGFDRLELVLLAANNTTPYGRSTFNPNTGVITAAASSANGGANASSTVQALSNGWYRFSVTVTYPAVTSAGMRLVVSNSDAANGDGVKGLFLWGAQLEASSAVTPYIPTTTAAVSVFESSWYNQTAGTMEADFVCGFQGSFTQSSASFGIWGITNSGIGSFNGYGGRLVANTNTNDNINFVSRYAPASQNNQINVGPFIFLNYGQTYKTVFAWDSSVIAGTSAGAAVQTNTNSAFANNSGVTQLLIGKQTIGGGGPYELNGTIKRLTFWPTRLSNEVLQRITQ